MAHAYALLGLPGMLQARCAASAVTHRPAPHPGRWEVRKCERPKYTVLRTLGTKRR